MSIYNIGRYVYVDLICDTITRKKRGGRRFEARKNMTVRLVKAQDFVDKTEVL